MTDADQKWDDLMDYGMINPDDAWLDAEEFSQMLRKRDKNEKISQNFVDLLVTSGKFDEHLLRGEKLKNEIREETERLVRLNVVRIAELDRPLTAFKNEKERNAAIREIRQLQSLNNVLLKKSRKSREW